MDASTVLSFDLDGTLVSHDFGTMVWREAIPALVARHKNFALEKAKEWVYAQYDAVGEEALEWYDLAYWFERFRLEDDWRAVLERYEHMIRPFPEVPHVLRSLAGRYRMIVLSNAGHPFVRAEIAGAGFEGLFDQVISATSDLGQVKKSESFYRQVCQALDLDPRRVIHVGDHWVFDYLAPARAGIRAFFLDRSGRGDNAPDVVSDLDAFARLLED
jgi:2-haloalkanoic acid dehalogenase type II